MAVNRGAEASSPDVPSQSSWLQVIWHRFSVRLVLVLGAMIFFAVVAIDSLQQATAADLAGQASAQPGDALVTVRSSEATRGSTDSALDLSGTYLEFDAKTAQRLQHSDLLGPQLTRSRLAGAHLFARSRQ